MAAGPPASRPAAAPAHDGDSDSPDEFEYADFTPSSRADANSEIRTGLALIGAAVIAEVVGPLVKPWCGDTLAPVALKLWGKVTRRKPAELEEGPDYSHAP
jgi:hypothetical protein